SLPIRPVAPITAVLMAPAFLLNRRSSVSRSVATSTQGVTILLRVRGRALVMPMSRDHIGAYAEACGHPAASHADREHVVAVLKAAFVQGRLTRDEFGTRVGLALMARTRAELIKITVDLPPELMEAKVPRQLPRTPRVSMTTAISTSAFAMLAALVIMLFGFANDNGVAVSIAVVGVLTFGSLIVASWQGKAR